MLNRFGDYLDEVTRGLKAEKGIRRQRVRQAWEEAVGSLIARNSEPLKIKGDTLIVRVTDTAWAQELSLRQREILKRLGLGDKTPTRLRCWVGQVEDLSAAPEPRTPATDWSQLELSEERRDWAHKLAAEVEDPELREAVERTLVQHEKSRQAKIERGMMPCPFCGHLRERTVPSCGDCRRQQAEERQRRILQTLAREPWLDMKELRERFPDLARQEFIHFHRRLANNFRNDAWRMFWDIEDGEPLPGKLRTKLLELTMLVTHLTPDRITDRHLTFALGRRIAASYKENRRLPKAEVQSNDNQSQSSSESH